MHVWIPQESFSSNWTQLQATTCVLNIELSTPERATVACNSWAVSPASIVSFVNLSSDSAPKYLLLELCIKVITLFINFSVWFFVAFFFQFAFLNLTEARVTCEPSLRPDEILETQSGRPSVVISTRPMSSVLQWPYHGEETVAEQNSAISDYDNFFILSSIWSNQGL